MPNVLGFSIFSFDLNFFNRSSYLVDSTERIRKFVCYHQGEFIQYAFLAGELHKKMKDSLNSPNPDKKIILRLKTDLVY
ncbi:MAG: hypothetical protein GY714_04825 [Desulfobacterales bacterium]|nr:hypothetical protein [Desulfobacterales bacterium]